MPSLSPRRRTLRVVSHVSAVGVVDRLSSHAGWDSPTRIPLGHGARTEVRPGCVRPTRRPWRGVGETVRIPRRRRSEDDELVTTSPPQSIPKTERRPWTDLAVGAATLWLGGRHRPVFHVKQRHEHQCHSSPLTRRRTCGDDWGEPTPGAELPRNRAGVRVRRAGRPVDNSMTAARASALAATSEAAERPGYVWPDEGPIA